MTIDYGADIQALPDLDPLFPTVTGRAVLIEAIARRLQTPRGALEYDPDYGLDLRSYLSEGFTLSDRFTLEQAIAAECAKDERVAECSATALLDVVARTLTATVRIRDAQGPFALVLGVDALTVTLLKTLGA